MAEFVTSPGCVNCPKCGGWQVLDYTKRAVNKEPLGPLDYRDCDKCNGAGQIRVVPLPVNTPKARQREVAPDLPINDIGDWAGPPKVNPWANLQPKCSHSNFSEVWGKRKCNDCGEELP